jgi:hypothetical protein
MISDWKVSMTVTMMMASTKAVLTHPTAVMATIVLMIVNSEMMYQLRIDYSMALMNQP